MWCIPKICSIAFVTLAPVAYALDFDFGDAPAPYPVTLAEGGARHASASALSLGAARNIESDGSHHAQALSPTEVDDGVSGPAQWPKQTLVTLQVTVNAACKLDAWVDWAADGHWENGAGDGYDRVALAWPLQAGDNLLTLYVPAAAVEGGDVCPFPREPNWGAGDHGTCGDRRSGGLPAADHDRAGERGRTGSADAGGADHADGRDHPLAGRSRLSSAI